ncbi:hypothetical protein [Pseudorhodoferax soli]|uniref:hypothetical protein n=1 Tax=Pseudorhodoferax soli TaxID=545864 RepID=UPI001B87A3FA|nr:hypothetical protein [Pseudorhodoferax soli]
MRWFFLTFVLLLAWLGNAAIFESFSSARAIAGVAFNIFILSLFVIWWSAYFLTSPKRQRSLVVGHALLMFAAGIALVGAGADAFLAGSCEGFISSGQKSNRMRSQVASYLDTLGYCRELGIGVALLGLFLAYPSIRLFFGITRRSSGPPSASVDL